MTIDTETVTEAEAIEGFDQPDTNAGFGEYPIDSLMIRNEPRSVHEVLRRIDKDQFILDPDFQRAFVWDTERQSRLIESVLMRIPLPVMYLAENPDGRLVVVDGLQRLTTFQRFVNNKFSLQLDGSQLDGKKFKELEMRLQNRIEDTSLILYIIDSKVPERVRLDIFERVNSGVALTRQQMRNCLYNGAATRWLRERADSSEFLQLFTKSNIKELQKSMRDREIVNRFVAFRLLGLANYRKDMDEFLGAALDKLNKSSDDERATLAVEFDRGIHNNLELFGRMAFRRHEAEQSKGGIFNVGLFDAWSIALSRYATDRVTEKRAEVRKAFYALLDDEEFKVSISLGTNQRNRVELRFSRVDAALAEVLGAP